MFWLPVLLLVFDFEPDLKYKLVKIWKKVLGGWGFLITEEISTFKPETETGEKKIIRY